MLYSNFHSSRQHLILRSVTLHHNAFDNHGLGLQFDDAHLCVVVYAVDSLITNVCDTCQHFSGIARNYKTAILIAHSMTYDCGVKGRQQGYGCVFSGIASLVNNTSLITKCRLLCAFHHNVILHLRHPDRIETYQLHNGIRNILVADALGHLKVLQLIIHKVDGVLMLMGIQVLQHLRERHIIILSGDALGIRMLSQNQQEEEKEQADGLAVIGCSLKYVFHKMSSPLISLSMCHRHILSVCGRKHSTAPYSAPKSSSCSN